MAAAPETNKASASDMIAEQKHDTETSTKDNGAVESIIVDDSEPQKSYYSKTSVWLMILFSGLAIGSDG